MFLVHLVCFLAALSLFLSRFLLILVCARKSYIHRLLLAGNPRWSLGLLRCRRCPLLVLLFLLLYLLDDLSNFPLSGLETGTELKTVNYRKEKLIIQ